VGSFEDAMVMSSVRAGVAMLELNRWKGSDDDGSLQGRSGHKPEPARKVERKRETAEAERKHRRRSVSVDL
jgi:hypothetical protein